MPHFFMRQASPCQEGKPARKRRSSRLCLLCCGILRLLFVVRAEACEALHRILCGKFVDTVDAVALTDLLHELRGYLFRIVMISSRIFLSAGFPAAFCFSSGLHVCTGLTCSGWLSFVFCGGCACLAGCWFCVWACRFSCVPVFLVPVCCLPLFRSEC